MTVIFDLLCIVCIYPVGVGEGGGGYLGFQVIQIIEVFFGFKIFDSKSFWDRKI